MTVAAIDVGGTTMKAARVDELSSASSPLRDTHSIGTPVDAGPDAVVAAIRELAVGLCEGVDAIGVVVPGVVEDGVARYAANLGWRDVPLQHLLADALSVPVVVGHDVGAAGVAERRLGAAVGVDDSLTVVIGTGIAGVVVSGGRLVRGVRHTAGEIGHVPVYPGGEPCRCGQRGCLETYASAASIVRRYRVAGGSPVTGADDVLGRLGSDPIADRVWGEATDALGTALVTATMLFDPAVIVLGGGLSAAGEALAAPVRTTLTAGLTWRPAPAVVISPLGPRAGLLGAALLAQDLC